ncbi:MAG: hypothetical protein JSU94_01645 [Phycisphaerales bacterium]|nr:MAG: hypothetical protein JSU94_01645 [Phycisphaerales bacterium]
MYASEYTRGANGRGGIVGVLMAVCLVMPVTSIISAVRAGGSAKPGDGLIDRATVDKWSQRFRNWHYYGDHVIPARPRIKGFEDFHSTDVPTVFQLPGDDKYYMTFIAFNGKGYNSFLAESDDLVNWRRRGLAMGFGPAGEFDHGGCVLGAYLYESYDIKAPRVLKRRHGKFWSLYGAYPRQGGYELRPGYEGLACSTDGLKWKRGTDKYILSVHEPDRGQWEKDCIYQPWLVEHEGEFYNFYNAANGSIEQLGLALSSDLFAWKRYGGNPVVRNTRGGYDERFCSDGKVFRDGDHWVMFYFGVGRGGAHIMAAFSRDLRRWTVNPEPLYKAAGHPDGLDRKYAHKISLVYNPKNDTYYMFYCAVGDKGRGIGLLTSRPIAEPPEEKPADGKNP